MELTHGRLKAALIAGKIPVTDEALAILRAAFMARQNVMSSSSPTNTSRIFSI